ncbi:hypothetical protein H0A61_00261 [Koleobacter methoxysyntrophicus]|jgi:hypothetical protein|uniref:SIR2-like domain-containing protein n=1 Tax=Koleobacter methoxysyntrophicus TaxID=2751313 RepID=A0A8A0RJ69_9FIRM|nr:SIR2 family protein [Koleobacter methoxysyntrophicus]MDI3541037.1 hypothetical protein [Thermosediminibacterales bacterium]MDK2901928.1 hypothetical protein [Thermosediminibacterales bacterium]QSQ07942.1 hypothetical protein H0A61_00261 [Koleobacter methoxysyntrophicus]
MAVEREPKLVFDRLIKRLLEGMVVPFIGAGVSAEAEHRRIKNIAKTSEMLNRVFENLKKKCINKEKCRSCLVKKAISNDKSKNENNKGDNKMSFDKVCELWEWSCSKDRKSETCGRFELIYDILEIPEFKNLEPTDAHYYIAFLAREGLIDEVITTNYDTCLEKAYCNTFGLEYSLEKEYLSEKEDFPALVIDTLSEYSAKAARRFTNGRKPRRCLRIYKINGCAGKLPSREKHHKDKQCKCRSILLTERDLQDWRHRSWARDLFRDRMRSRTLLFSGFGSDEPQVRFTAMQVCEEFALQERDNTQPDQDNNNEVWLKPNAPFIAAYKKELSFSQAQILHAFAHSSNTPINPKDLNANSFLGSDIKFFDSKSDSNKQKLKADIFWKRIFQSAFWRLLRKKCWNDDSVETFLMSSLPCATALMIEVLDWFASEDKPEFIFGRFPEMLDLKEGNNRVLPLMRWLKGVRAIPSSEVKEGWYSTLNENSALFLAVLMLIYLLNGLYKHNISEHNVFWQVLNDRISEQAPLGLCVDASFIFNPLKNIGVYIVNRDAANQLPEEITWNKDKEINVIIQIVLNDWKPSKRRVKLVNEKNDNSKVITVYQISFLQLLGQAPNVPEAKKTFCEKLRDYFLLTDKGRHRVRHRSEPL